MRVHFAFTVLALACACRRDPPPPPPRATVRSPAPSPRVDHRYGAQQGLRSPHPLPQAPPLPPPSPDAVALGFDMAPIDDAFGEADTAWLVLTLRHPPPTPVRELHHFGPQRGCSEIEALVLREHGASTARRALISARCEGPPRADYSVLFRADGTPEVVRSGCTEAQGPCGRDTLPDEVITRVALPTGLPPLAPSPLARREGSPPFPPRPEGMGSVPRGAVRVRWVVGPVVDSLVPGRRGEGTLALLIEGEIQRRLDTPALGRCTVGTGAPAGALAPRGATMVRRCEAEGGALRWLSVEHRDDMLRLHVTGCDSRGVIVEPRVIAQRVALVPGTRVSLGD